MLLCCTSGALLCGPTQNIGGSSSSGIYHIDFGCKDWPCAQARGARTEQCYTGVECLARTITFQYKKIRINSIYLSIDLILAYFLAWHTDRLLDAASQSTNCPQHL